MENYEFYRQTVFELLHFEKPDLEITYESCEGVYVRCTDARRATVGGAHPYMLCRALFLLARHLKAGETDFEIRQQAHFDDCGVMLDCSRNGVMTTEAVKRYIRFLAALGLNFLMLYTEDTYEIPEYPFFGYLRGRYTADELREIDDYAARFGIEVIPCIQTLGHLEQFLQWPEGRAFSDTRSVLLIDDEKTYAFIEAAIRTLRGCLRTRRIHIGMDEAHDVGRGRFLDLHGWENRFDMLNRHLGRVVEICKRYDFRPMMWSDMYFRLGSPDGRYYVSEEVDFPASVTDRIADVDMVYWDYYSPDVAHYDLQLRSHAHLGRPVLFAGGISIWYGQLPWHDETVRNSHAAMQACLKNGVRSVFATMWGDDGAETNVFYSVPYLPIYAEYCYCGADAREEDMRADAEFLTGVPYRTLEALGSYHMHLDGAALRGKPLFYNDPLYNLLPYTPEQVRRMCDILRDARDVVGRTRFPDDGLRTGAYAGCVLDITILKGELFLHLRDAYRAGDRAFLTEAAEHLIPRLIRRFGDLARIHRDAWASTYKNFGYEVISHRYGGSVNRLKDIRMILQDYLAGKTPVIEELEAVQYPVSRTQRASSFFTPSQIY